MVEHSTQTIHVADSKLLEALSAAFAYPMNGLSDVNGALSSLAPEHAGAYAQRIREVLGLAKCFETRTAEQLAYTRLFIGSMRMEAPPYPSYYLEEEHTLFGQAAVEVQAIYRQFGLELGPREIEPPDHLRFLLAFLSLLAGRYEETGEPAFAEAYTDFCEAYIFTWIDDCAKLVDACAEEPYYPALMTLIVDVLRNDMDVSNVPTGD